MHAKQKVTIFINIPFSAFGIKETPAEKPNAKSLQLTENEHTKETDHASSHNGNAEAECSGSNDELLEEPEHPDSHDRHAAQSECSECCVPAEQTELSGSHVPAKQTELPTGHHITAEQDKSQGSHGCEEQTVCPGSCGEPAEQGEHSGSHVQVSSKQTEGPGSYVSEEQTLQVECQDSHTPITLDDSGISIEGDQIIPSCLIVIN